MRDIWYRRIVPVVVVVSAAVIGMWWRIRSRPTSAPSSPPPTPTPGAAPIEPPVTPAPPAATALPLVAQPQSIRAMLSKLAPVDQAMAWFLAVIALCLFAALVVHSSTQAAFNALAPIPIGLGSVLVIGLIITRRRMIHHPQSTWPLWTWRFAGIFAAIIIAFKAADVNFNSLEGVGEQLGSAVLWLIAIGLAIAAAWLREPRAGDQPRATRWEVLALIGIVLLSLALRVIDLEHIPAMILGDETKYAVASEQLIDQQVIKPFTTGADGHWNLYLMITSASIRLFGQTVTAMRLPSALMGVLSIVATFAVARLLWGRRTGLFAAALLAAYHHHIHFSRTGFNSIYDPLFSTLAFATAWYAWRSGRRRAWLLAALAAGLSQYFFVGGRLVLIQLAVLAVFWLITEPRRVRAQALNITLALGVFLCVVTPILYFVAIRSDEYMGSLNAKNIYLSGWVPAAMAASGLTEGQLLWRQFQDVQTSFVVGSDEAFYWGQTMLTPIMGLLALLAMLYGISHLREGRFFWIVSAFSMLIILGGILIVSPTAGSHRLLGSGPLIYIAIAALLDRGLTAVEHRVPRLRVAAAAVGVVIVGILMIGDAHYYFVDYLTNHELQSPEVGINLVLHYLMDDVQPRTGEQPLQIVCVGFNSDWCRGTPLQFLAPRLLARAEVITDLPTAADIPPSSARLQIVIVNAALPNEAQNAAQRHPAVKPQPHYDARGKLVFVSFEVPPAN